MADVKCFLIEPTEYERRYLRRYVSGSHCPATKQGYHNAMVFLTDGLVRYGESNGRKVILEPLDKPKDTDARWPKQCGCGYQFTNDDPKQLFNEPIYERVDTHEETALRDAAPGAIWEGWWNNGINDWSGPDGKSYYCKLPDGTEWLIDGPSVSDGKWERTGVAPNFTVTPSIASSNYHGWLRNGVLSDA